MKNTALLLGYLTFILLFMACKQSQDPSNGIPVIALDKKYLVEELNLSSIADFTQIIFPETSDDFLIGEIRKIVTENGYLYISDGNTLFKHDLEGKMITAFNKAGSGPEEYSSISDFEIRDGRILLLSRYDGKLFNYSWNGELLNVINLKYGVNQMVRLAGNKLLFYMGNDLSGDNYHRIKLYNTETETYEKSYLDIDMNKAGYLHINSVNHFSSTIQGDGLYYFEMFNDTVYHVQDSYIKPAFILKCFNNYPEDLFEKGYDNIMEFFQVIHRNGYSYGTPLFLRTPTRSVVSFYSEGEAFMGIVPLDGKEDPVLLKNIVEDIHLENFVVNFTETSLFIQPDNRIALIIEPIELLEYYRESGKKNPIPSVTPDSNPVILLLNLK